MHSFEMEVGGRSFIIENGKMAKQANGAVLVRYGDTVVLVAVTASAEPREGVDFFPLTVDYEEKMYSVGKIPGGFIKREGRPSNSAILCARLIDRPIRPLFPKDLRNDCSVVATVMSVDPDCSPEITAAIGVSAAIAISDIPWGGPISSVNVGIVDGEIGCTLPIGGGYGKGHVGCARHIEVHFLDVFKIKMTAKLCNKLYRDGLVRYIQITAQNMQ